MTDGHTEGGTDISDSRDVFATEKKPTYKKDSDFCMNIRKFQLYAIHVECKSNQPWSNM